MQKNNKNNKQNKQTNQYKNNIIIQILHVICQFADHTTLAISITMAIGFNIIKSCILNFIGFMDVI